MFVKFITMCGNNGIQCTEKSNGTLNKQAE